MADLDSERKQEEVAQFSPLVLKVQEGGDIAWKLRKMTKRENRAITGLILLGALGYFIYGVTGAVVAGIIGALIGYFWD